MTSDSHAPAHLMLSDRDVRALGQRLVDFMIARHLGAAHASVGRVLEGRALERLMAASIPAQGRPIDEVWDQVTNDVLGHALRLDHPRFFAYVPGPNNFVSVVADALVAACNVFAGSWISGGGPAQIEINTIRWLAGACGLPAGAGGHFVSGGTHASLTGLMLAREVKHAGPLEQATAYCSDQTHASVLRALRVLGIPAANARVLASDNAQRLPVAATRERIKADLALGMRPFCVIANAGTTSTGAVDPIEDLAQICREYDLWLHADGAYGAAAALCDPVIRRQLGVVDSLALDPHKWLFQPIECGCVLARDGSLFARHFSMHADYLDNLGAGVSYLEEGIQLTRTTRALKLWMSLQVFGADAFRAAVACGIGIAEKVERRVARSAVLEVVTPARIGIVTFAPKRRAKSEDALITLCSAIRDSGYAMLSTTRVGGRPVLRMCTINPRTTDHDLEETLTRIEAAVSA